MRFVVEYEGDTDTSLETSVLYKVFEDFDDAADLFRKLRWYFANVTPLGPDKKWNIISGKIYHTDANSDAEALEEVKAGKAFRINDLTSGDDVIYSMVTGEQLPVPD